MWTITNNLIHTEAESTRTILPGIILPQLIRFYNTHKESINDLILSHRKRKQIREQKERDEDICVAQEEEKKVEKLNKRDSKRKQKKLAEEVNNKTNGEKMPKPESSEDGDGGEDDIPEGQLFDHLTHNLNDDASLFKIDDVDINYIVFNCKPLVLSTDAQLEEACEKEMQSIKGRSKTSKSKSKRFDTYATIDSLSKKEADTVGSLQTKGLAIQNIVENSCNRSVKEFLKSGPDGAKSKKSISSRRSKRLKNEVKVDEDLVQNVYLDPIVSLFFYFRQHLLSEKWNVRQYCCANLVCMINQIKLQDYLSNVPDLGDIETLEE